MVRTIPINATVFKDGLRIVESYVTVGTRFVFKWELYAEYGKCFYDLEIPENYDEEGKLRPENERGYYRYMVMPKNEEYVSNNIIVCDLLPEFEVVN